MSYLEQAIKEAVEKGGYFPNYAHDDYTFGKEGSIGQNRRELFGIFLDPDFWKALGKARGWEEEWNSREVRPSGPIWIAQWEWFVRHLAEGRDAESFFKSLSDKPKQS